MHAAQLMRVQFARTAGHRARCRGEEVPGWRHEPVDEELGANHRQQARLARTLGFGRAVVAAVAAAGVSRCGEDEPGGGFGRVREQVSRP
jgi:hypothetical protein